MQKKKRFRFCVFFFFWLVVGRNMKTKPHGFWDARCILLGCKPTIMGEGKALFFSIE